MTRGRDRDLERRLLELRAPRESEAEEDAWPIVREAYAERAPLGRTRRRGQVALALAGGLAVIAIGLSPAGAEVGEFVSDVTGIGEEAKPSLRSLPAAGELLVRSDAGLWVVRDDGSKRLLGDYDDAAWSPNGRFIAAARGSELLALDPEGEVQWALPTAGAPSQIIWEGTPFDTRIAFRAGGDLYVAAGDGTGAHRIARDAGSSPPAWLEVPGISKVDPALVAGFPYVLAYLDDSEGLRLIAPDSGATVTTLGAMEGSLRRALVREAAGSPLSEESARVRRSAGRSNLYVAGAGRERVVFSGPGAITDPTWSPDGRWLLVGRPAADQWLFIEVDRPSRVVAFANIRSQFEAEGRDDPFPRAAGWVLPAR